MSVTVLSFRRKLLLDNNLSPRLTKLLDGSVFECVHVSQIALESASDAEVWSFAQTNGYNLVSKDSDFVDLLLLHGYPPKLIWIKLGNCRTTDIIHAFTHHQDAIMKFIDDADLGLLELNH